MNDPALTLIVDALKKMSAIQTEDIKNLNNLLEGSGALLECVNLLADRVATLEAEVTRLTTQRYVP